MKKFNVVFKNIKNLEKDISCLNLLKLNIKKSVLIKPNLLTGGKPGTAICTNVYVLKALINWLKSKGVKKIILADGSGTEETMRAYKKARYDKLDVDFIDLNADKYIKAKVKDALEWPEIEVAKTFYNAKYIINVPVAKCHHQTGVSLGIKNLLGVLKPLGDIKKHGTKSHIHHEWSYRTMPEKQAKELFERRMIDLLRVKKINLTLIDGTFGLQFYESSHKPIKTDFLIASKDILSAEILCSKVMGFNPNNLYYLKIAQKVMGKRKVNIIGDKPRYFNFGKSAVWSRLK